MKSSFWFTFRGTEEAKVNETFCRLVFARSYGDQFIVVQPCYFAVAPRVNASFFTATNIPLEADQAYANDPGDVPRGKPTPQVNGMVKSMKLMPSFAAPSTYDAELS